MNIHKYSSQCFSEIKVPNTYFPSEASSRFDNTIHYSFEFKLHLVLDIFRMILYSFIILVYTGMNQANFQSNSISEYVVENQSFDELSQIE